MKQQHWLIALSLSPVILGAAANAAEPSSTPVSTVSASAAYPAIELRAAGSLQVALNEIIAAYQLESHTQVAAQYAPSGLLLKRIQAGEKVDLFASANMQHPQTLVDSWRGDNGKSAAKVQLFARNQLCALAQEALPLTSANLLETLLDPKVKVGTSTPKADPAGDYAWRVFAKAEELSAGAQQTLAAKALQLTGGPNSAAAPKGRNPYAWVMENKQADVFLTYCTNAVLAQQEVPNLQLVALPKALAVGADYGLLVLPGAHPKASALAEFMLSAKAQGILSRYGFQPLAE
ncbi:MAG: molybdate ABC transporter substrate-binding protein [Shewanella sp.]